MFVGLDHWGLDALSLTPDRLNEKQLARQKAIAAKLVELGITPAEATLFNLIHYGITVPPSDLCRRARSPDYWLGGPVTKDELAGAFDRCLEKSWLQIVDETVLDRLKDEVRREGLIGPIYGYPPAGAVDYTRDGAHQWSRVQKQLYGWSREFAYCDIVHDKLSYFFPTYFAALAQRNRVKEWEVVTSVEGPYSIGPWRANWWRRFSSGYRLDVEERMQWDGRASGGGGGHLFFDLSDLSADPAIARDILDRHNVEWVEWIVLASLEDNWGLHGPIVHRVRQRSKQLSVELTESECEKGLQACMRNGWIRRVDEPFIAEVRELTAADSALMPIEYHDNDDWMEMDFSTDGALLYRMISGEIFGPGWEDGMQAEICTYREEHRYCATVAGISEVLAEYRNRREFPTSQRMLPIGPWCVYWWQRSLSGYRLEMTFGKL